MVMAVASSWGALAAQPPTVDGAHALVEHARGELLARWGEAARATWVQVTSIDEDTQPVSAAAPAQMSETTVRLAQGCARFDALDLPPSLARVMPMARTVLTVPAPANPAASTLPDNVAPLSGWLEEQNAGRTCGW